MEECSVLIESTLPAEDKTSRWFNLPIDYELFRDLLGVEADSKDYQIIDMKLPFAGDIVRTTSVRRLNKLYFAYMELPPEVQQAYNDLISYCGGVEDLLQKSEEFRFYPECHSIMDVARYRLEHNIEFSALSEKGKKYFNLGKYNEGELVGDWFSFPLDEEVIAERIGLNAEYEEYAIHDTDNFPMEISEYISISELNRIYEQLEELPDYMLDDLDSFVSYYGSLEELVEHKDDIILYSGCETMTDLAYYLIDEEQVLGEIPSSLQNYIDYEAYGRDLDIEGTFIATNAGICEVLR